jgi:hypothetical protein
MYGSSYNASFNGKNTRIAFCDNDGGVEAQALFHAFLNITNPTPDLGLYATVQKMHCSSVEELKTIVLEHASNSVTGKATIVGGVYVPAGYSRQVQAFVAGAVSAVTLRLSAVADDGFNPNFMNRAVHPVFTASFARYNSIKTSSFFKASLDQGIAAAAAAAPGSAARASLTNPAQVDSIRMNAPFPIGSLASTLGVIFLFVQCSVGLSIIHPTLMPLFGKIKIKHYLNIRRIVAYSVATCFAVIGASVATIFGTYNSFMGAKTWIFLVLSCWLIITTFGVTISFCQFVFGPLAPTAIGIFQAISIASAQFDSPWACLPDFYQIGRAMAMPNGVELLRCVLFGSCYNIGANIGILIANQAIMMLFLTLFAKVSFLNKINSEKMQKFGQLVSPASHSTNLQGAMHAGVGMAISSH